VDSYGVRTPERFLARPESQLLWLQSLCKMDKKWTANIIRKKRGPWRVLTVLACMGSRAHRPYYIKRQESVTTRADLASRPRTLTPLSINREVAALDALRHLTFTRRSERVNARIGAKSHHGVVKAVQGCPGPTLPAALVYPLRPTTTTGSPGNMFRKRRPTDSGANADYTDPSSCGCAQPLW